MKYNLIGGGSYDLPEGTHPYETCNGCPVFDRCKRRTGEAPLPRDYATNPDCVGYVMLEKALRLSGLPPEYQYANKIAYRFNPNNAAYANSLQSLFERTVDMVSKGSNLAFMSPHKGTGKTFTAATILNEYIIATALKGFDYERPTGKYLKFSTWANKLRRMYQLNDADFSEEVMHEFDMLKEVPLLVIDDIGSGRITNFIRDMTYELIDHRKENLKSTIFTTNLTREQMEMVDNTGVPLTLGDIITSRLFYNTIVYDFAGIDLRDETTLDMKQHLMQKGQWNGGQ